MARGKSACSSPAGKVTLKTYSKRLEYSTGAYTLTAIHSPYHGDRWKPGSCDNHG